MSPKTDSKPVNLPDGRRMGIAKQNSRPRRRFLGLSLDDAIKYFFAGNAMVAIVVLLLIMVFLFKEGADFWPMNNMNLRLYREAGLEYVDIANGQLEEHTAIGRGLNEVRMKAISGATADIDRFHADFVALNKPRQELVNGWKDKVLEIKGKEVDNHNFTIAINNARRAGDEDSVKEFESMLQPVDVAKETAFLKQDLPVYRNLNTEAAGQIKAMLAKVRFVPAAEIEKEMIRRQQAVQPVGEGLSASMGSEVAHPQEYLFPSEVQGVFGKVRQHIEGYMASFPGVEAQMEAWSAEKPIRWYRGFTSFLFGREWITNSFWQDFYGLIPLLTGSVMVSVVALVIAVPLSVAAAIYANQVASPIELKIIKPYIEFIQAIPSIVLGFFGIAVLGTTLRDVSEVQWLSWIPGFPMSERLNITTAGVLLALLSVPIIFTLVEDALNNVPKHFVEASYALGANRMQTVFKIMIPAALSGIIAAILLGFGRVVGETMVVLLCCGGRIAIPDFTQGIGAFFQPAHTMTGLIAQEMGEVEGGSIHYRALFMVGIVLFFISLALNYLAQIVVRKFKISIG